VTGGAGFIGNAVTAELLRHGYEVTVLDIAVPHVEHKGLNYINADVLDINVVRRVLIDYNIDSVIHLVGLPEVKKCQENPDLSFKLNTYSVQNVIEAMRLVACRKIIFASSATVYGNPDRNPVKETDLPNPTSIYGYHKFMGELVVRSYAKEYDIKGVILRLFNVFGGNPVRGKDVISVFLRKIKEKKPLTVYGPNKFRDFINVDEVAQIISASLLKMEEITCEDPVPIINVGSGEPLKIVEIANFIEKNVTDPIEIKIIDTEDDGTGFYADISKLVGLIRLKPKPSKTAVFEYIKSVLRSQQGEMKCDK